VRVPETVGVLLIDCVEEAVASCDAVNDGLIDAVEDWLGDTLAVDDTDAVWVDEPEFEAVTLAVGLLEGEHTVFLPSIRTPM
jgi:hypothetical protein